MKPQRREERAKRRREKKKIRIKNDTTKGK